MKTRVLLPEDVAMLGAIIAQRYCSNKDTFIFDPLEAQKYLANNGALEEYNIDLKKQSTILKKLSDYFVIDMDYIMPPGQGYKPHFDFEFGTQTSILTYEVFWVKQRSWAYDTFQEGGRLSVEQVYKKYGDVYYIRMTQENAQYLYKMHKAEHTAQLMFDTDHVCLSIKFDQGEWIGLSHLSTDGTPYKILNYAWNNPNRVIKRDELISEAHADVENRNLRSQVFQRNETVKALIPLFLRIDKDSIMFIKGPVTLTLAEINQLETRLKLFR